MLGWILHESPEAAAPSDALAHDTLAHRGYNKAMLQSYQFPNGLEIQREKARASDSVRGAKSGRDQADGTEQTGPRRKS